MRMDRELIYAEAEFKIENVGSSPAFAVTVNPTLTVNPTEFFHSSDHRRAPLLPQTKGQGSTVLGKRKWKSRIGFNLRLSEIEKFRTEQLEKMRDRQPELADTMTLSSVLYSFFLNLDFQYEFFGSDKVHRTSLLFLVQRRHPSGIPDRIELMPLDPGEVDLSLTDLIPMGSIKAD